jgi:hypothetical protein
MTGMRLPASGLELLVLFCSFLGFIVALAFGVSGVLWGISFITGLSAVEIVRAIGLVYVGICIGVFGMFYADKKERETHG